MNELKHYCNALSICGSVLNENALISSQGIGRVSWGRTYGVNCYASIIDPHRNYRNTFVEDYD
jgi:hypothetical protein